MVKINVFEPHVARDFDVCFQKDAALETKVDVRYLQYSVDEIDKYITQTVKPELDDYVAAEKSKLISYHLDLNNNILSLEGTDVVTSTVDLGELSYGDRCVTLLGAQNIDSVKTFTQNPVISKNENPALEVQNTSVLFGSAPLEDQLSNINFTDATGTVLGGVQYKICEDASVVSSLSCSNLEASESSEIAIGYDENGDVYTSAPTPASGDNSTKIATTAFVEEIKQNLQGEIALKEDIISDLTTIRTGASFGATAVQPADLATVATSGNYNDLSNKPTIPAAQVNADWNASSGVAQILNKPTIPTVNNATLTIQKNGTTVKTFTANASSNVTANITVPTKTSDLTNDSGYITGISSSNVTTALGYTPAKTDLSNLSSNGKKVLDGQWVYSASTLASSVSCPSTSEGKHSYSLSTYLPDDTYSYEVLFDVVAVTNTTAGKIARISLTTDLISSYVEVCFARTASSTYYAAASGSSILPIGTGRTIGDGYWAENSGTYSLRALAYRRIGTNS